MSSSDERNGVPLVTSLEQLERITLTLKDVVLQNQKVQETLALHPTNKQTNQDDITTSIQKLNEQIAELRERVVRGEQEQHSKNRRYNEVERFLINHIKLYNDNIDRDNSRHNRLVQTVDNNIAKLERQIQQMKNGRQIHKSYSSESD